MVHRNCEKNWIQSRNDVEELADHSAHYRKLRIADPKLEKIRFPKIKEATQIKRRQQCHPNALR